MTREDFVSIFNNAVNLFREKAPKDTGHLAFNAIKGKWISDNHFKIWIDKNVLENQPNIEGKVAGYYYAGRLNNDTRYKTYNFVEKIAREIAQYIANKIGGTIKK